MHKRAPPLWGGVTSTKTGSLQKEKEMGHWLLTWTTYGTWLPGDERGYVSKTLTGKGVIRTPNRPGEPYAYNHGLTEHAAREKLKRPPVYLTTRQAMIAVAAMEEAGTRNRIKILAGSFMKDHCHVIVDVDNPSRGLNVLKGASGHALSHSESTKGLPWWTSSGKKDHILTERHLAAAIAYVRKQKNILASFGGE